MPETIPAELIEHISVFELPTGVKLRRFQTRNGPGDGWVLDLGFERYMYRDGTTEAKPRIRAYIELGFKGGEDDLDTDADWQAVEERTEQLVAELVMGLDEAWAVARQHGLANRHAVAGEQVTLADGVVVRVTDPGTEHDRGHWVRVAGSDGVERVVALTDLRYDTPVA